MYGAVIRAEQLAPANPNRYIHLEQFKNPANPRIHVKTTGPRNLERHGGNVDVLVAAVGTGGTVSGVSRYFKLRREKANRHRGRRGPRAVR